MEAKEYATVARCDVLLARHVGAFEADNKQQAFTLSLSAPSGRVLEPVLESQSVTVRHLASMSRLSTRSYWPGRTTPSLA